MKNSTQGQINFFHPTELKEIKDYINTQNHLSLDDKTSVNNFLQRGVNDQKKEELYHIIQDLQNLIKQDQQIKEKHQYQLLQSCSKIELALALHSNQAETSQQDYLKNNLLKDTEKNYHYNIEQAIQTIYPPKPQKAKSRIIGKILNLCTLFNSYNIIDILQNRLQIISYHEKTDKDPKEISLLNGSHIKEYFIIRDRQSPNKILLAGEESIRSLYQLFAIKPSLQTEKEIQEAYETFQNQHKIQASQKDIQHTEEQVQTQRENPEKFDILKAKIQKLVSQNQEMQRYYQESLLEKLAQFQKHEDTGTLLKELLPTRGFLKRFDHQKNLPNYIQEIINKFQNKEKRISEEESMFLYLYFAQHHLISITSIQHIINNLKVLQAPTEKIQAQLHAQYLNIFAIIEILETLPNYFQQVQEYNQKTTQSIEKKYQFSLSKTIESFRPFFLLSQNMQIKELDPKLYVSYYQVLDSQEQKDIKTLFSKRSFKISNYQKMIETKDIEKDAHSMEDISQWEEKLKKLVIIKRKLDYYHSFHPNHKFQKYLQTNHHHYNLFQNIKAEEKKLLQEQIRQETEKNKDHKFKGNYILKEEFNHDITKYFSSYDHKNQKDKLSFSQYQEKIDESLISKRQKNLRKSLYSPDTMGKPFTQKITEQQNFGIISPQEIKKIQTQVKQVASFEKIPEKYRIHTQRPYLVNFSALDKNQLIGKKYAHNKEIQELQKIYQETRNISRQLKKRKLDDLQFVDEIAYILKRQNQILLNYKPESIDFQIEEIHPDKLQKKYPHLTSYDPIQIQRLYQKIQKYQSKEKQHRLIQTFKNLQPQLQHIQRNYGINISKYQQLIQLIENTDHILIDPDFFKDIQDLLNLMLNPNKLKREKQIFFAQKRRKHYYNQFLPEGKTIADVSVQDIENNPQYQTLKEKLNQVVIALITKLEDHSKKNYTMKELINGISSFRNEKNPKGIYDSSTQLRDWKFESFLGKESIRAFLLGQEAQYQTPKYIKRNLQNDKPYLKEEDFKQYEKKLQEIEKYINNSYIKREIKD